MASCTLETTGQDDGPELAHGDEIVNGKTGLVAWVIDPHGRVAHDVDAMHGEQLPGVVGYERRTADHRDGELDPRHLTHGGGDRLRKETVRTRADLESGPPGHVVDNVVEGSQHRPVDQVDRADERDATRERNHGEAERPVAPP